MQFQSNTIYNIELSDVVTEGASISKLLAENLFKFFQEHTLFRWQDANNDCEDRANAICILLDEWKIPNYKGWIFGGNFLFNKEGNLINNWKYHVATIVPVGENAGINLYVIDPAALITIDTIFNWATVNTQTAFSHYLIKWGHYYIFPKQRIQKDNWHKRNRQNYKWTMQGLSGINGASKIGKAQICFNKNRIKKTEQNFQSLLRTPPAFLPK